MLIRCEIISTKFPRKLFQIQKQIYYLYTIIFNREIIDLNSKALLKEVIKEEMEFTKEVAKKSDIDLDDEELYSVGNMIKEIKLEEELAEKEKILEEKDKTIEENKKTIEEKDKIIKRLKEQLKRK